ncbi:MAG TPA: permease [Solirubrobacterales bacterium]|nr:permease [Solirubrobacterales bacterium]
MIEKIWEGLEQSFLMAYEVWWALVIGFAISGIVQAWVPRARIEGAMSGTGFGPIARATGLGAASSSCSYAAIAIARSLFAKGASAITALAFQFASTNLVWELGLVLWVLMGWQFTLAEFVGGIVMIALMAVMLRRFVSPALEERARRHAEEAAGEAVAGGCGHDHGSHDHDAHAGHDHGSHDHHDHGAPGPARPLRESIRSADAWREVAGNFRMDWSMLWKEIAIGFLLAGFIGLLGDDFFNVLFITDAPPFLRTLENVIVGPLIAVLSFVCSVGNVPLAAVLWSGGIGFGGVVAFLFADLIVIPIVLAYRKYYGNAFAFRIVALMFVTIVLAALIVDGVFGVVGLVPTGPRPSRTDVFGSVGLNYKLVLNVIATAIFLALVWLSRPVSDGRHRHDIVDEHGQEKSGSAPAGV